MFHNSSIQCRIYEKYTHISFLTNKSWNNQVYRDMFYKMLTMYLFFFSVIIDFRKLKTGMVKYNILISMNNRTKVLKVDIAHLIIDYAPNRIHNRQRWEICFYFSI